MSALEVLLQTRVPAPLAKWVRAQAKAEGMTVATWLRWTLLRWKEDSS